MTATSVDHVCSVDSCPASCVSDGVVCCFACSTEYYGKCVGIDATSISDESSMQFICPECLSKRRRKDCDTFLKFDVGDIPDGVSLYNKSQQTVNKAIAILVGSFP